MGPPTPPTPPTPPSPSGGSFTQKQCTDSACASGSAQVSQCGAGGLVMKQWLFSTTCSGAIHTTSTQPVDQCLQDTQGSYFENECGSTNGAPLKTSGLIVQ